MQRPDATPADFIEGYASAWQAEREMVKGALAGVEYAAQEAERLRTERAELARRERRLQLLTTLLFARLALWGALLGHDKRPEFVIIRKHIDEIAEVTEQFPEIDQMLRPYEDQGDLDALMEEIEATKPKGPRGTGDDAPKT